MSREFKSFQVGIVLHGGPFAGRRLLTDSLDAIKLVFSGDEAVHAYVNQNDGVYLHSPDLSAYFSRDVAATRAKWADTSFHVSPA